MFYYSGSQGAVLPVTGTQSMFLLVRFTTKYLWYKCFWAIITKSALVLPRDELFGVMSQTVWNDFGADSCESKFHSHFSFTLLFSISLLFSTLLFYSPVLLTGQLRASAPFFFFFLSSYIFKERITPHCHWALAKNSFLEGQMFQNVIFDRNHPAGLFSIAAYTWSTATM